MAISFRTLWSFPSNCENSQWRSIAAMISAHQGNLPAGPGWFLTSIDNRVIDHDS
jgi:hypothetical protein